MPRATPASSSTRTRRSRRRSTTFGCTSSATSTWCGVRPQRPQGRMPLARSLVRHHRAMRSCHHLGECTHARTHARRPSNVLRKLSSRPWPVTTKRASRRRATSCTQHFRPPRTCCSRPSPPGPADRPLGRARISPGRSWTLQVHVHRVRAAPAAPLHALRHRRTLAAPASPPIRNVAVHQRRALPDGGTSSSSRCCGRGRPSRTDPGHSSHPAARLCAPPRSTRRGPTSRRRTNFRSCSPRSRRSGRSEPSTCRPSRTARVRASGPHAHCSGG